MSRIERFMPLAGATALIAVLGANGSGPKQPPSKPIPPRVTTKAYGCDAKTGQCDLIIAYMPRAKVPADMLARDVALDISQDGKWVTCRWGDEVWCRKIGSDEWSSRGDCERLTQREQLEKRAILAAEGEARRKWGEAAEFITEVETPATCDTIAVRVRRDMRSPWPGRDIPDSLFLFDGEGRLRASLGDEAHRPTIAWSPGCSAAAIGISEAGTGRMSNTITMLDCKTFEMRREVFKDHPIHAGWSPDRKYIALVTNKDGDRGCSCGLSGGTLAIFDPQTGHVERYPQYSPAGPPAWSPDSRYLALASAGGLHGSPRLIFDMTTRRARPVPEELRKVEEVGWAQWSPDGRYVAYGDWRESLYLLDTRTWDVQRASKKDAYLPRDAKDGNYVLVRPAPREPQSTFRFGWWHWVRLGQVVGYEVGCKKDGRLLDQVFVRRAGKPGRTLVLDRVFLIRPGKPRGTVVCYEPLAFTWWSRGSGPARRRVTSFAWRGPG